MYDQIFSAVKALAVAQASPYTSIGPGAMPQKNGLAMYPGPGIVAERYLDRGGTYEISIVLNGKHSDLSVLASAMSRIHRALTTAESYPQTDDWKILSIETTTPPNYLDRETSDTCQWLYGSILNVKFYVKGVD